MAAFADYKPSSGSGGGSSGGGGGKEAASADSSQDQKPTEAADTGGGGGGDWPPHSVMGLPSLSPTMSQGMLQTPCHPAIINSCIVQWHHPSLRNQKDNYTCSKPFKLDVCRAILVFSLHLALSVSARLVGVT